MSRHCRVLISLLALLAVPQIFAQGTITTIAGTEWVFNGDGKPALSAPLGDVSSVTMDRAGNPVFSDPGNAVVVRLNPDGRLTVLAGNGLLGYSGDGGQAPNASLNYPQGVAFDSKGNLYIADTGNNRVRMVTPGGVITTVAGNGRPGFDGDGGAAVNASLFSPLALAIDPADTLYISDVSNFRIRRVTADGNIRTFAGNGQQGFSGEGVAATQARLDDVEDMAFDTKGNLYLVDRGNNIIRKVDPQGIITTFAGNRQAAYAGDRGPAVQASLDGPGGIAVDSSNNFYISDTNNLVIRKIDDKGIITTFAGSGNQGADDGPALSARFRAIFGLTVDSGGNLFVTDRDNSRVRKVSAAGTVSTVAGTDGFRAFADGTLASNAFLFQPFGVGFDPGGNLFVADTFNNRVARIAANGTISNIAGNGGSEFSGDFGLATRAGLSGPTSVTADGNGNLYIADTDNQRIRKIFPNGTIRTVAGNGDIQYNGDSQGNVTVLATQAALSSPQQAVADSAGNLYISDFGHNRIRKVTADGTISTFAGSGAAGFTGDLGPAAQARLNGPTGLAFDAAGNLFVADWNNARIRKITTGAISTITTIAGGGTRAVTATSSFDATQAQLGRTLGVAVDKAGTVYFSDGTYRVYKVTASGIITLVAGNGNGGFSGDGGPSTAATLNFPYGLAVDPSGSLLIADAVNNRIRSVLAAPVSVKSSPVSLSFSGKSGGALTDAQNIGISSSVSGLLYSLEAKTAKGGDWLKANVSTGSVPATVQLLADPSGLDAGTYTASIVVTAPGATPPTSTVDVSFTVAPADKPVLTVGAESMAFTLFQGALPATQNLSVVNQGGGSLPFTATASTETGGNWLSATSATGAATPVVPASVTVQTDPGGLAPGTYTGTVTIASDTAGTRKVKVILTVNAVERKLLLSQTGLKFTAVAGGGAPLSQNFAVLNAGQGDLPWTVKSVTLGGGSDWLVVSPGSGSSTAGSNNVPLVDVAVNAASLNPGEYYGRIQIFAPTADNSPQTVSVVLEVLPAGTDPGPEVRPSGLIFTGAAGSSPGSQNLFISNLTTGPISYSSSRTTDDGAAWFLNAPTNATVVPNQPARIVVQPDFASLPAGTYSGTLRLVFAGGVTRTVNILSFVGGEPGAATQSQLQPRATKAASCNDKLVLKLISPQFDFNMTATQPQQIQASLFDNCNNPVSSGMVKAGFKTGDKTEYITMVSRGNGSWEGTWQPSLANPPQVSMYIVALLSLPGGVTIGGQTGVISGTMKTGGTTPLINNSVQNSASFVLQPLVAPGALISIFGQQMTDANQTGACLPATNLPLATELGGAQVFLDNSPLALLYACDGQINAQIPYDIATNARHQLWLQRNSGQSAAQSIPVDLSVAPTQPAIFTTAMNGTGQGVIFLIKPDGSQNATPADPAAPVAAGDTVVIFCSGLGVVTPQVATGAPAPSPEALTVNAVSVSIGGQAAEVLSAGLVPNNSGVYQVRVKVPQGVAPGGEVPVVLSAGGQNSPIVTMGVK